MFHEGSKVTFSLDSSNSKSNSRHRAICVANVAYWNSTNSSKSQAAKLADIFLRQNPKKPQYVILRVIAYPWLTNILAGRWIHNLSYWSLSDSTRSSCLDFREESGQGEKHSKIRARTGNLTGNMIITQSHRLFQDSYRSVSPRAETFSTRPRPFWSNRFGSFVV